MHWAQYEKARPYRPQTVESHTKALRRLALWLDDKDVREITAAEVSQLRCDLLERGCKIGYVSRQLFVLRALLSFCQKRVKFAFFFLVLLFSFIGIPPTAGFFGKLYLFQAVLEVDGGGLVWLAVVAGANTVVSAYYYMNLIKTMYLDEATADTPSFPFAPPAIVTVALLTVPILVLGIFASPLLSWVKELSLVLVGG